MENIATELEVSASAPTAVAELEAIVELSANALALVGGGAATVIFE
jgi:hypothetical protein